MGRREQDLQQELIADVSNVQCRMGFKMFQGKLPDVKGFQGWQFLGRRKVLGKVLQRLCVCVQKMTGRPRD